MAFEVLDLLQDSANDKIPGGDRLVNPAIAGQIACDPNTEPYVLRKLGESPDGSVRQNVAANPNTPTDILLKLGAEFPEELLHNPIFPLLYIENPDYINKIPTLTVESLLKLENVPVHFLTRAANRTDRGVRLALTMNSQTPKEALEQLLQSQHHADVAAAARLHVNWAGEMSQGWEEEATETIQTLLAEHTIDREYIQQFKQICAIAESGIPALPENSCVLQQIAENPDTPAFILEQLAKRDEWEIDLALAANPSTPSAILKRLSCDRHWWITLAVARNPNAPAAVLAQLAGTPQQRSQILYAVAMNAETPTTALYQLLNSEYPDVAQAARWNLYWACEIRFPSEDWDEAIAIEDASNPSPTEINLQKLARDNNWEIRQQVARNPHTPAQILADLAKDPDLLVRLEVAANPSTHWIILSHFVKRCDCETPNHIIPPATKSESLLGQILDGDREYWLTLEVAKNPSTPGRVLAQLACHEDYRIRRNVAKNPNTPGRILERLATDKYLEVRQNVAENPNLTASALDRLIQATNLNRSEVNLDLLLEDAVFSKRMSLALVTRYLTRNPKGLPLILDRCVNPWTPLPIRFFLLSHPKVPDRVLVENSRSLAWIERYAIACHLNTPTDTLAILAQDGNRIVRAAAKVSLQQRNALAMTAA